MDPRVPDLELFVVLKWTIVVIISAGLAQYSALWVKRKWYGPAKHDRRTDVEATRGWIERFLDVQEQQTKATVSVAEKMQQILTALESNGRVIEAFTKSAECKYPHRR